MSSENVQIYIETYQKQNKFPKFLEELDYAGQRLIY